MKSSAKSIAKAIIEFNSSKKFEEVFQFNKGIRFTTKKEVIRLLKEAGISASFSQKIVGNQICQDESFIIISRGM